MFRRGGPKLLHLVHHFFSQMATLLTAFQSPLLVHFVDRFLVVGNLFLLLLRRKQNHRAFLVVRDRVVSRGFLGGRTSSFCFTLILFVSIEHHLKVLRILAERLLILCQGPCLLALSQGFVLPRLAKPSKLLICPFIIAQWWKHVEERQFWVYRILRWDHEVPTVWWLYWSRENWRFLDFFLLDFRFFCESLHSLWTFRGFGQRLHLVPTQFCGLDITNRDFFHLRFRKLAHTGFTVIIVPCRLFGLCFKDLLSI